MWAAMNKALLALLVAALVCGCASVRTLNAAKPGAPIVYSGTRLDLYALQGGCCAKDRFGADAPRYPGLDLPATLYADMGGSLMASEAVLQARLLQLQTGKGLRLEVALSEAARYLALPRTWGLTQPGGAVGGAHAGYQVYACKDGRVALAALEPHFARRMAEAAGMTADGMGSMLSAQAIEAIARFMAVNTRAELEALAVDKDIPLLTLPR